MTVDVFCGSRKVFGILSEHLSDSIVCDLFAQDTTSLKRFEISELNVIKFSFPRTIVQGCMRDRDMHGAQYSVLLAELAVADLSPSLPAQLSAHL